MGLNGKLVLDHSCETTGLSPNEIWETPFLVDVMNTWRRDRWNTIAVAVNNRGGMGGIWKPVHLVSSDEALTDAARIAAWLRHKRQPSAKALPRPRNDPAR